MTRRYFKVFAFERCPVLDGVRFWTVSVYGTCTSLGVSIISDISDVAQPSLCYTRENVRLKKWQERRCI